MSLTPDFEKNKIESIKIKDPIVIECTLENHGYLLYQADDNSKERICSALADQPFCKDVRDFLQKAGHVTLVGNFSKQDKSAFDGKKSVKGVLEEFNLKTKTATTLLMTEFVVYDGGKFVCARISKPKGSKVLLREDLPRDKGINPEWYDGTSHMTLYVGKGYAPKHSNTLLLAVDGKDVK